MKLPESRCVHCGSYMPEREVADDEVCNCGSRICLVSSGAVCRTTNRPRTGTFRRSAYEAKQVQSPPRDTMLRSAPVRK